MASKFVKDKTAITYDVHNVYGTIKENDKNDWITAVLRMSWNENPDTVDIRNINLSHNRVGKGVSLTNEETDLMVDILLQNDFGSIEEIEKALEKRKSIYTPQKDKEEKDYAFIIDFEDR